MAVSALPHSPREYDHRVLPQPSPLQRRGGVAGQPKVGHHVQGAIAENLDKGFLRFKVWDDEGSIQIGGAGLTSEIGQSPFNSI